MEDVTKAIIERQKLAKKLMSEDLGESFQRYNQGYIDALSFVLELLEEDDLL